jgi:hypothetical protein
LDNSATARARAPAVSVPNPRLNPLLKVAPALTLIQINYRIGIHEFACFPATGPMFSKFFFVYGSK